MGKKKSKTPKAPEAPKKNQSPALTALFNNKLFASAILFVVSFAVFIPSLSNDFVWDDVSFIVKPFERLENESLSIKRLLPRLTARDSNKERTLKYYRPVHGQSLVADAKLWGKSPFGFHFTNIILHSISTILLYFLFLLVLKEFGASARYQTAFLSSMLFALYPLHVESVSFIAARGDILTAVFLFAGFILYILSYRRFLYIVPSALSFYLSFLSKEVALTFPILIVGFDFISRRIWSRVSLYKYLLLGFTLFVYLYSASLSRMGFTKMLSNKEYLNAETGPQIWEVVTIFFSTYFFYLKKLVYPFELNPFIGTIPGGDPLYTVFSIIVIAALVVIAIISVWKKENVTGLSVLWIFATLGPAVMIAVFPLAITRYAERFLYIPSAGFCLLLGYLIIQSGVRLGRVRLSYVCGAILCVSFLVVTIKGQAIWKNEFGLWEYAILKSPKEIVPKMNYADALRESGRDQQAETQYKEALKPGTYGNSKVKALASENLGDIYLSRGEIEKAERQFEASLNLYPENEWRYHFLMGRVALKKNDPGSAEESLTRAVELNPEDPSAYYLLGSIYIIRAGVEKNPDFYITARDYLKKSTKLRGATAEAHLKLAMVYAELGDVARAKRQAEVAIKKGIQGRGLNDARSILNIR